MENGILFKNHQYFIIEAKQSLIVIVFNVNIFLQERVKAHQSQTSSDNFFFSWPVMTTFVRLFAVLSKLLTSLHSFLIGCPRKSFCPFVDLPLLGNSVFWDNNRVIENWRKIFCNAFFSFVIIFPSNSIVKIVACRKTRST